MTFTHGDEQRIKETNGISNCLHIFFIERERKFKKKNVFNMTLVRFCNMIHDRSLLFHPKKNKVVKLHLIDGP